MYQVVPPEVEYQLTVLGAQVAEKLNDFMGRIEMNLSEILQNKACVVA